MSIEEWNETIEMISQNARDCLTLEECESNYEQKGIEFVISDGHITSFTR